MSLRIRLARAGAKKRPFYRVVVADVRCPRDGRFIEKVGTYNPLLEQDNKERVIFNKERITHWLSIGAKPTDRVERFLGEQGIINMPVWTQQTKKDKPKAKARERLEAQKISDVSGAKATHLATDEQGKAAQKALS